MAVTGIFSPLLLSLALLFLLTPLPARGAFPEVGLPPPGGGSPLVFFTPSEEDLGEAGEMLLERVRAWDALPGERVARLSSELYLARAVDRREVIDEVLLQARGLGEGLDLSSLDIESLLDLAGLYLEAASVDRGLSPLLGAAVDEMEMRLEGRRGITVEREIDFALSARAALLLLGMDDPEARHRERATAVLDFIIKEGLRTPGGGFYRAYDLEGGRPVGDGYVGVNAWVGLSLLEGYRKTGRDGYLEGARQAAGFISENLFDAKVGGFMKRNSTAGSAYGEDPLFMPGKDFRENSAALLLLVGLSTPETDFSTVIDPSIGYLSGEVPYLEGPFSGAHLFIEAYSMRLRGTTGDVASGLGPEATEPGGTGGSFLVLLVLAFIAGVLSFLSPCTLPILPAYFAFAFQGERTRIVLMTFAFFLGLSTVFTFMGATASFIGSFIREHMDLINLVGGSVIILFGAASVLGRGFEGLNFSFQPAKTFSGSFVFGATIAVGWTACVGPILASFLIMASQEETVAQAMVLLFIYAMGLGLPLMIISAVFKNLDKQGKFWQFIRGKGREFKVGGRTFLLHTTNIAAGLVVMALGVLVMTGYLSHLNRILPIGVQNWLAGVEDRLMQLFI